MKQQQKISSWSAGCCTETRLHGCSVILIYILLVCLPVLSSTSSPLHIYALSISFLASVSACGCVSPLCDGVYE